MGFSSARIKLGLKCFCIAPNVYVPVTEQCWSGERGGWDTRKRRMVGLAYICVPGALKKPQVGWASLVVCMGCKQWGGHDTNPRPDLLKEWASSGQIHQEGSWCVTFWEEAHGRIKYLLGDVLVLLICWEKLLMWQYVVDCHMESHQWEKGIKDLGLEILGKGGT